MTTTSDRQPGQDPANEPRDARTAPSRERGLLKIRVPQSMVAALEEYLETLRTQPPFIHMSRAEAIRWLIALGLERDRAEQANRRLDAERLGPREITGRPESDQR